jgi:hypothetical protein
LLRAYARQPDAQTTAHVGADSTSSSPATLCAAGRLS